MRASKRLIKELKGKINYYKLYKNFTSWRPEEFGRVDYIVEKQREFELKNYGYYQKYMNEKQLKSGH
ncbi:hypothetical protein Calab_1471 [Caldithrix abyssi DSM 13497]|uniref:Uncharacterized protein n=1 Tax=Caldithrix abyssi DSM 13497 TaxID=880073 RepID=H1XPW6_CALAY|nr:hypothetical protein [Caldithrix abyssi]APF20379.1 hypothetical protein Cabys_3633 [Caldithrix abyssi DSM 13497]EHO41092.1 hypothetical protein Calab_1471 [Caldithrix abyssi DSM 13497]